VIGGTPSTLNEKVLFKWTCLWMKSPKRTSGAPQEKEGPLSTFSKYKCLGANGRLMIHVHLAMKFRKR